MFSQNWQPLVLNDHRSHQTPANNACEESKRNENNRFGLKAAHTKIRDAYMPLNAKPDSMFTWMWCGDLADTKLPIKQATKKTYFEFPFSVTAAAGMKHTRKFRYIKLKPIKWTFAHRICDDDDDEWRIVQMMSVRTQETNIHNFNYVVESTW